MTAVTMTTREHLAWLADYWRPHRGFAGLLVLWTLFSSAVAVAYPLVWKVVVEGLETRPQGASLADADLGRFAAILVVIALGRVVVGFYPACRAWMNLNVEKAVRERVFASILAKDHTFFGRFRTGDLVTRLTDDIAEYPRIAWFSCSGVFRFLDSSARVFFCAGAMVFYCDARLALLSMIPVPRDAVGVLSCSDGARGDLERPAAGHLADERHTRSRAHRYPDREGLQRGRRTGAPACGDSA